MDKRSWAFPSESMARTKGQSPKYLVDSLTSMARSLDLSTEAVRNEGMWTGDQEEAPGATRPRNLPKHHASDTWWCPGPGGRGGRGRDNDKEGELPHSHSHMKGAKSRPQKMFRTYSSKSIPEWKGGILPNSFHKATIILIPNQTKTPQRKLQANIWEENRPQNPQQNSSKLNATTH